MRQVHGKVVYLTVVDEIERVTYLIWRGTGVV